jgi:hypothetical protein
MKPISRSKMKPRGSEKQQHQQVQLQAKYAFKSQNVELE